MKRTETQGLIRMNTGDKEEGGQPPILLSYTEWAEWWVVSHLDAGRSVTRVAVSGG